MFEIFLIGIGFVFGIGTTLGILRVAQRFEAAETAELIRKSKYDR